MKKIWERFKVAIGAIGLALFGALGYWGYERAGYEHNVLDFRGWDIGKTVIVGDTGQPGKIFDAVLASIKKECPSTVLVTSGPSNEKEFKESIMPFDALCPGHNITLIVSGNHGSYALKDREWLANRMFEIRFSSKVAYPNYYYGAVFADACVLAIETTVYDVLIGDPKIQERQEKFADKFLSDSRCEGKRKIAFGHHPIYSSGDHGNAADGDFIRFYMRSLVGKVAGYFAGHDHNLSAEKQDGITANFVSGSGSKLRECRNSNPNCWAEPGYLVLENGTVTVRKVSY